MIDTLTTVEAHRQLVVDSNPLVRAEIESEWGFRYWTSAMLESELDVDSLLGEGEGLSDVDYTVYGPFEADCVRYQAQAELEDFTHDPEGWGWE